MVTKYSYTMRVIDFNCIKCEALSYTNSQTSIFIYMNYMVLNFMSSTKPISFLVSYYLHSTQNYKTLR